jgi:hypothetical protein
MSETVNAKAECECGQFSVQVNGAPVIQLVCHCNDCRAISGQPYTEGVFFAAEACTIHGQSKAQTMKGGSGYDKTYYSCAECGTTLYCTVNALNGACAVMAAQLVDFNFEPQAHVWTSEKAEGVTIPDSAIQSPKAPPKEIRDGMLRVFWGKGG